MASGIASTTNRAGQALHIPVVVDGAVGEVEGEVHSCAGPHSHFWNKLCGQNRIIRRARPIFGFTD